MAEYRLVALSPWSRGEAEAAFQVERLSSIPVVATFDV
jgi:hypothetical protein